HFEKACRIYEKTFGPEHYYMSRNCYDDLCFTYTGLNDFDKAKHACEQGVALSLKIDSQNLGQIAVYYNRLGNLYYSLSGKETALAYYKRAAELFEKADNPDHSWLGWDHYRACELSNLFEKYEDALYHCDKALAFYATHAEVDDKSQPRALLEKGVALHHLGRGDEAIADLQQAVSELKRIWGTRHPVTFLGLSDFAGVRLERREYEDAEQMLVEVIENTDHESGEYRAYLGDLYESLTKAYVGMNRGEEAVKAAENCLEQRITIPYLTREKWHGTVDNLVVAKNLAGWGTDSEAVLRAKLDGRRSKKLIEEKNKAIQDKD
ncbi:tetratricopeptide repeat protein, partial [bacterium]|nr:tetratricopeptide repeat protein [bacterium]